MAKNLSYNQAIAAVTNAPGVVFARREGWTDGGLYIGLNTSQGDALWIWDATSPGPGLAYSPTSADQAASDWIDGTDKPPRG